MTLLYSSWEEDLRVALRALLAARLPVSQTLVYAETAAPPPAELWSGLVDMGLTGLAIPERLGGTDAGWPTVAVALEELGRAVAPVPYLGTILATAALLECADPRAEELLREIASGGIRVALAVPFGTGPAADPALPADGGHVRGVADALDADVFLVPAEGGLYAVGAASVVRTPVVALDQTRPLVDLEVPAVSGTPLAGGSRAARVALDRCAALLASEQLGVAEWCLATTVEYVRTRYQFARPVGSFQAVKHRLADVWVSVAQARAVARYAAGTDDPVAAPLAQAHCGPVAVAAAEACVQLHGGIGFTWEHPAHLYLKRAKASALAFGTADRHRARLAELVDLPAA
ncbi:acyl-CoA dehydrogenase family protein [Hamadaea tsunoensis]|uniref:acyl-CoA dehydrogenase family protein n=1 Tax=Hamadaea tsunoensis TaxID=53368 RepID=UPI000413E3BE|nr:acyl-CoA dehydrogenase family protein [Hamadaea tsunoensis]